MQTRNRVFYILLFQIGLLCSCSNPILIEGFSGEEWRSDKNGCAGYRNKAVTHLIQSKGAILKQSEYSLLKFLGKPDRTELMRRNQKNYIYLLQPGPACDESISSSIQVPYLSIKFNATGIANEIYFFEPS